MTTTATLQRRLIRTKEAANYLCMSDWKLRRLIQEGIFPVLQDHEGGPFLLDVRDLDIYIKNNKRTIPDLFSGPARLPVVEPAGHHSGSRRTA
jgi:excisionase family DNA binding protein